jgi:C_GCAxxG_C_C family probable redox protein
LFIDMISRDEKRFNCCESTLIRIDGEHPIPGFDEDIMRVASNFGGGIGGWGSACGAVTGAAMALGLLYGTNGDEPLGEFEEKRKTARALTQEFMKSFEEEWSTVRCIDLLGVDFRTPEGREEYEEMKMKGETQCEDYVEWASNEIINLIGKEEVKE